MLRIERCVCLDLRFDELQELARERSIEFNALQRLTGCGTGCGLCVPYIREMLRTGTTVFHELLVEGRSVPTRGGRGRRAARESQPERQPQHA